MLVEKPCLFEDKPNEFILYDDGNKEVVTVKRAYKKRTYKKRTKVQCEHNRYKPSCCTCRGLQICEHQVVRNTCGSCKEQRKLYYHSSLKCHHGKCKYDCKLCKEFRSNRNRAKLDNEFDHYLDFFIDYFEKEETDGWKNSMKGKILLN